MVSACGGSFFFSFSTAIAHPTFCLSYLFPSLLFYSLAMAVTVGFVSVLGAFGMGFGGWLLVACKSKMLGDRYNNKCQREPL